MLAEASNAYPPSGFYCPRGTCQKCTCSGDKKGIHACGDICCDRSPTLDSSAADGLERPCYTDFVCPPGKASAGGEGTWWECEIDGSTWMSAYPGKRLDELYLPGTHDSGTYSYKGDAPGSQWALAQSKDVMGQLKVGIRYLDLRLRIHKGKLWIAHSHLMVSFSSVKADLLRFTQTNPSEVILIKLRRDDGKLTSWFPGGDANWPFDWSVVTASLASLSSRTIPPSNLGLTLGQLTAIPKRRLIFLGDTSRPDDHEGFPSNVTSVSSFIVDFGVKVAKFWPDAHSSSQLCEYLKDDLAMKIATEARGRMVLVEAIVTPDARLIAQQLSDVSGLQESAKRANLDTVGPFVQNLNAFGSWKGVVALDHPDWDLIKEIILKNEPNTTGTPGGLDCNAAFCISDSDCKSQVCALREYGSDTNFASSKCCRGDTIKRGGTDYCKVSPGERCADKEMCESGSCYFPHWWSLTGECWRSIGPLYP